METRKQKSSETAVVLPENLDVSPHILAQPAVDNVNKEVDAADAAMNTVDAAMEKVLDLKTSSSEVLCPNAFVNNLVAMKLKSGKVLSSTPRTKVGNESKLSAAINATLNSSISGNLSNADGLDHTIVSILGKSAVLNEKLNDSDPAVGSTTSFDVNPIGAMNTASAVADDSPSEAAGSLSADAEPSKVAADVAADVLVANKVASWVEFFKDNRQPSGDVLKLQMNVEGLDNKGVTFTEDLKEDEQEKLSLIGIFPDKFPGRDAVLKITNAWSRKCDILYHASGWIVFTFKKEEDLDEILQEGPYYAFGKPLMLRKMPMAFNFSKEACSIVPVWVQLLSLPLIFWNDEYLSRICTFLGKPLYTDKATALRSRISFARCLVEVDVNRDLPTHIPIFLKDGKVLQQPVHYEQIPKFCKKCRKLGHNEAGCDGSKNDDPKPYINRPRKTSKQNVDKTDTRAKNNGDATGNSSGDAAKKSSDFAGKKGAFENVEVVPAPSQKNKGKNVAVVTISNGFDALHPETGVAISWGEECDQVDKQQEDLIVKNAPSSSAFTLEDVTFKKLKKKKKNGSGNPVIAQQNTRSSGTRGLPPLDTRK